MLSSKNYEDDIASPDLEEIMDSTIYGIFLEMQPSLVLAVADLLRAGETPIQIEARMAEKYGNVETVRYVRSIAEHLARTHKKIETKVK